MQITLNSQKLLKVQEDFIRSKQRLSSLLNLHLLSVRLKRHESKPSH